MTEQPAVQRVLVTAVPGSRLESLLAAQPALKAAADEAAARFEACKEAIKSEASALHPHATDIIISGTPGLPSLRMTWQRPWRFNTRKFKAERPLLYVMYAERKGHWDLREAGL